MLNSKQRGISTELQCLSAFANRGIIVSIPYGDCARYDFIADINHRLYRIQCKTASLVEEGAYQFACRSTTGNTSEIGTRSYTEEQIDFFATIIEEQCCLIPVQETGSRSKTLRTLVPKNNKKVGISYVSDYLLDTQLEKLIKQ